MRSTAAALALSALALAPSLAEARPFRGSTPVYVLLCQTNDAPAPPRTAEDMRNLVFRPNTGGAADYLNDVTYQNFNNNGSEVFGWYTVNMTTAEFAAVDRFGRINLCLDAAARTDGFAVPAGTLLYTVTNPPVDIFGYGGGAFLPINTDVGLVVHEGGHGIGLDHSFSNDRNYRNASWAQRGEYDDPWDAMSYGNTFRVATPFGDAPVGFIAPHLDRFGWLPRSRIITHGQGDVTYTLAALGVPETPGALLVRVPFDPNDRFRYYTIEFRAKTRWDAGIPNDLILIHEVARRDGEDNVTGQQIAFLQRDLAIPGRDPMQNLSANGVEITLLSIDSARGQATVRVRNSNAVADVYGPNTCKNGFVWREADDFDWVCVAPGTRSQTAEENALAPSRRNPGGGPFGPNTCVNGFVFREAFPGDQVCVTRESRSQARADNNLASSRLEIQ